MSIRLSVYRRSDMKGAPYQISIEEDGHGGYRIGGPKFVGNSERVYSAVIEPHAVPEIRRYLDMVSSEQIEESA